MWNMVEEVTWTGLCIYGDKSNVFYDQILKCQKVQLLRENVTCSSFSTQFYF